MIAENTYTKEWVEAIVKRTVAETIDSISNLDNGDILFSGLEREENMSSNNRKIRRPIVLNGARVWVTGNTEQEYAENLLRLAGCQQTTVPRGRHLFREYADHWFETFSKPNIAKVTILSYERQLRLYIYPVLGDLFLEDITVSDVQKVFNRMGDDKKQTTKDKAKIVLSQIFKMAYEEQIIDRNPMQSTSLKIKGNASDQTKPYTVEQMKYLAAHLNDISGPTRRAWLALSIALPLRPEEVLGLKWGGGISIGKTGYFTFVIQSPTQLARSHISAHIPRLLPVNEIFSFLQRFSIIFRKAAQMTSSLSVEKNRSTMARIEE